jgi:3-oxoacyl-[acyl-carrier protein] reductase
MDLGLRGKVAAVAAASSGLGRAVALELAREGASVALCSRDPARVEAAVASIAEGARAAGQAQPQVAGWAIDLAARDGPERFVRQAVSRFARVDILVANNGGPAAGPTLALPDEAWEAGFRLTFESSRRLAGAAVPGMRERRWGRIVFITSTSVKQPIEGLAISTAMRSAVVGYAKALSDELARDGITVNCVAPGSTRTERLEALLRKRAEERKVSVEEVERSALAQIPARRFGAPAELAAAVAFLASERASYITGAVLAVDGGQVRSLT